MEMLDGIKTRRSHRKFKDEKVPHEVINKIIDAARYAPSWKNTQVVRYNVIESEELLQYISENCVMEFLFNAKTIMRCSALVVVSAIEKISGYEENGDFTTSLKTHWQSFDAGIATQTFCLAAHSLNVASVILGIFDENKIKEVCKLPDNQQVMALIAIGYPLETDKEAPGRLEVKELVNYIE